MLFSIALLLVIVFISYKISPKEKAEHAHVHGAGQIGLAAAVALFGVDYFTSFYYGTGELMSALHPYGLQKYGYIAAAVIAIANFVFGALYMYSLGVFNEGGGSYTASMRYLKPTLSLIVAVTLIEDYVLTIVVSALSGGDQLLSLVPQFYQYWWLHFAIGALLALGTWYVTIRGRGESSTFVFTLLGIFVLLTITMAIGLFIAHFQGRSACAARNSAQISHACSSTHALADGFDERHGGPERSGSHVQRHPVCDQRRRRNRQMGKAAPASPQESVEFLQRQVGHRAVRADLVSVLWRADHVFPGRLFPAFRRF